VTSPKLKTITKIMKAYITHHKDHVMKHVCRAGRQVCPLMKSEMWHHIRGSATWRVTWH
jgi:hypothetical protein